MRNITDPACDNLPGTTMLLAYQGKGETAHQHAVVANEVPVALTYDAGTYAVMMATPDDLHDFAVGFSLTEGVISKLSDIDNLDIVCVPGGIDIQMALLPIQRDALTRRRRHMAGPVGCGLCGIESIEAALRPLPRYEGHFHIGPEQINQAIDLLSGNQPLKEATHCTHAAGFYVPGKGLVAVREDIGRHNALDKLIGALFRAEQDFGQGIIVVTSRLSVEMVQKAAAAGVPLLAAVSAPTAKAVQIAGEVNITLVTRVRDNRFEVFTGPQRIS